MSDQPLESREPIAMSQASHTLVYAPQVRRSNLSPWVIGGGLFTTALVLLGIYYLELLRGLMGLYLQFVPLGALLLGGVAGSGYGIVSWLTGFRIRHWLLCAVVAIQVGAYVGVQYLTFLADGPFINAISGLPTGFLVYVRLRATSVSTLTGPHTGTLPWLSGYGLMLIECAAFVCGAVAVPLALVKHPYCDLCLAYMSRKSLGQIRAAAGEREINRKDAARVKEYAAEQRQALSAGLAELANLERCVTTGDAAQFKSLLPPSWREVDHLPRHIRVYLFYCRRCHQGRLQPVLITGQKERQQKQSLPETLADSNFVRAILQRSSSSSVRISRRTGVHGK